MSFELVDIVDENDVVVGTIERTPEWNKTRHTIHRYVDIFVKLSDGRFLMQQRLAHKKGGLKFNSPVGGLVTSGLSYEQAAKKELKEELGLDATVNFVAAFHERHDETDKIMAFAQLFEITSDGPFTGWEEEAERLEIFTADELNYMTERFPYLFVSGFLKGWAIYRQINNF
jgi:8-oxo-dGTP pyrophosphatase MutT (NUDIX family)